MRQAEPSRVRWLFGAAVGYCVLMFLLVGFAPPLARLNAFVLVNQFSPDSQYMLRIALDFPLPFHLNGKGRHPGELRVFDRAGRVIDEEHVPDVSSIHDIRWTPYQLYFVQRRDDKWYRSTLDLKQ